jgi:CBS-domain-containing membrane protein
LRALINTEQVTKNLGIKGGYTAIHSTYAISTKKAVRHMQELRIRRLPVINKNKRMIGILSLGDVGNSASVELVSGCVKSVSAHHA